MGTFPGPTKGAGGKGFSKPLSAAKSGTTPAWYGRKRCKGICLTTQLVILCINYQWNLKKTEYILKKYDMRWEVENESWHLKSLVFGPFGHFSTKVSSCRPSTLFQLPSPYCVGLAQHSLDKFRVKRRDPILPNLDRPWEVNIFARSIPDHFGKNSSNPFHTMVVLSCLVFCQLSLCFWNMQCILWSLLMLKI